METMFRVKLNDPVRDPARGIVELSYREDGVELDITNAGRGLQQVLLLLAHMNGNPGAVLLLDEPDAHLEVLRQRDVYGFITESARAAGSQLIIASHSEVVLQEATDRDLVVSFVGIHPRRVDDRGSQVLKALRTIRAEDYYQAERVGFVLYLEGSTDLAILRGVAKLIGHPSLPLLAEPFVSYVGNVPTKASEHFFGLKAAKSDLKGFALFDRLDRGLPEGFGLLHHVWSRREIENYIASKDVLMAFAAGPEADDLIAQADRAARLAAMQATITELETASKVFGREIWSYDEKISDNVLTPLFANYFRRLGLSDRMNKADFHILVDNMTPADVPAEMVEVLDKIVHVLGR